MKVTYIVSDIDKALAFEWIADCLNKEKFTLHFILLSEGSSYLQNYLLEHRHSVSWIKCAGKKDYPAALAKTISWLRKVKPDVVHCHLQKACIIGLTAAKLIGIKQRIYTRHHSSLHHVYHPKGIWIDKFINKMATHIVAISPIVKDILINWEGVLPSKVVLIPHGFNLKEFNSVSTERVQVFKEKHQLQNRIPVIGVISRFEEWKGIQYIIPAFEKFLAVYPHSVLLLLNARGMYEETILKLLQRLPVQSYRLIPFEKDIQAAYGAMDLFVHVPTDNHSEAYGQIYVEALAAGLPSVFTLSGIATSFVEHKKNAFVVPYKSEKAILEAMLYMLQHKTETEGIKEQAFKDVHRLFSLEKMITQLEALYVQK